MQMPVRHKRRQHNRLTSKCDAAGSTFLIRFASFPGSMMRFETDSATTRFPWLPSPITKNCVAFVAAPYGFGPSSKAIAIASHLPNSIERVFYSDGPALDLALASREFRKCIRLDFNAPPNKVGEIMSRYRSVVFVNTTRFLTASSQKGNSLVFVDTLAWIRRSGISSLPPLSAYFAQRFYNHCFADDLESTGFFQATGAIVPKMFTNPKWESIASKKSPIVHCGGLFSPAMRPGADATFVTHLCTTLNKMGRPVRVILPKYLHSQFATLATSGISLIDCSPVDVKEHIEGSLFALTTSGIEFTYESALLGVPTLFLPPFNATQLLQLDYHRRQFNGSVPFFLNLQDQSSNLQSLDTATAAIQTEGMSGTWNKQFQQLGCHLKHAYSGDFLNTLATLQKQQERSFATVGGDGGHTIASQIISDIVIGKRRSIS